MGNELILGLSKRFSVKIDIPNAKQRIKIERGKIPKNTLRRSARGHKSECLIKNDFAKAQGRPSRRNLSLFRTSAVHKIEETDL